MKLGKFRHRTKCRACESLNLNEVINLGTMPLAGGFLKKEEFDSEMAYPLKLHLCMNCKLLQIVDVVSPDTLFTDYKYRASNTETGRNHFNAYAEELFENHYLKPTDLVVEIGCNDGVLLKPLSDLGANAIGIDPARNIVEIVMKGGFRILNRYFSKRVALDIVRMEGRKPRMVLGSNVFAHIDDMEKVMDGIETLLAKDSILSLEVHYLPDLVSKLQYDIIYSEHLCYWSLATLKSFLEKHGLIVFDAERKPMHGGSIRIYASREGDHKASPRVAELLDLEHRMKLEELGTYINFGIKIERQKKSLLEMLKMCKNDNKTIVGYGAPGRGNTMLCYCGIDNLILDYLVDASPSRYGYYTPGTHIPIYPVEQFRRNPPDIALMLAWSYQTEILQKEQSFIQKGGKWIIPLPEPRIYDMGAVEAVHG